MNNVKRDERRSAESAWLRNLRNVDVTPARIRPLQYTLFVLLTLFILGAVGVLSTRSIWIDEAMLLKSVYEIGIPDFLNPLPYYNQASPFIPSVIIKLISMIAGTNFILFRWLIFVVVALCAAPLLIKMARTYGMSALLAFIILCTANVYNILLIATEIKHYGFEVAAVFIFLYWFLDYIDNPDRCLSIRRIWIPLLAISMGFSTFLLVPAFLGFLIVDSKLRMKGESVLREAIKKHGLVCAAMLITAALVYVQMKHLTIFQIENSWSSRYYGSKGILVDSKRLYDSIIHSYTYVLFVGFTLVTIFSWFVNVNSALFRVNMYFTLLAALIFLLKLLELYPVFYARHLFWIIPISATVGTLFLHHTSSSQSIAVKILRVSFILCALAAGAKSISEISAGVTEENENNNSLYAVVGQLDVSDILVMGYARPSLEIYQMANPSLSKHRYVGLMPGGDRSILNNPPDAAFAAGPLRDQAFTDWQFAQLPQTVSFLLLMSHADPIDHEPALERVGALRNTLNKNRCAYKPAFTAHGVQLVKVACPQSGDDEAPAKADNGRS